MPKPIISDTSCFIVLSNVGELNLLQKLYGEVITTPEIASEYGEKLPEWVNMREVSDKGKQKVLA